VRIVSRPKMLLFYIILSLMIASTILVLSGTPYQNIEVQEHKSLPMNSIRVAIITNNTMLAKEIAKLLKDIGIKDILICDDISKVIDTVDVSLLLEIIKNSKSIEAYLVKGKILVTTLKVYKETILPILKRKATILVEFANTEIYALKFIEKLPKGRYVTTAHGVLGKIGSRGTLIDVMKWCLKIKDLKHTPEVHSNIIMEIKEGKRIPMITASVVTPTNSEVKVTNIKYEAGTYSPYWKTVGYVSWCSGDSWKPYGRLSIEHACNLLMEDGTSDMDWWTIKCVTEGIPGDLLWRSGWRLEDFWNYYYLKYYDTIYELRDYEPTARTNPVTISFSEQGVTLSWTYPADHIDEIRCYSDLYEDKAAWWHNIHVVTTTTIKIAPGFLFTVLPVETGKQRWEISAQWMKGAWPFEEKFKGGCVVEVTFLYP